MRRDRLDGIRQILGRQRTLEFVRFVAVGGAGAAAYFLISLAFHHLGLVEWMASILAYASVLVPVYLLQHSVTFRSDVAHRSAFPKYVASQALGMAVATLVPAILERSTELPAFAMFASVAAVVPVTNYLLLRFWTFRA